MASLTVVRSCADRIQAESIRIRLAEAGIRAMITGTDMETALGLGGAGTMRMVRVEVPAEDAERAAALLDEDDRKAAEAGPWICSRCHEQNEATFEVCWSCSKPRTEDDERGRLDTEPKIESTFSESITIAPEEPTAEDGNPYRPIVRSAEDATAPPSAPVPIAPDTLHHEVRRAFRAAVIGAFVFPPLVCFYSLFLLLSLPSQAYRTSGYRRKVILIWFLNLALIFAWTIWWLNYL